MYERIGVAIDNSAGSGLAGRAALRIARACASPVTGIHAYTGRYHQSRFTALEPHLPEKYRNEKALDHQRAVHTVLIGQGLELISSEYMKKIHQDCEAAGIPFTETIADGKNSDVLIEASKDCGLMVMGADGLGRTPGSGGIGSTTRRVLRFGAGDLLIARNDGFRRCLACVDGSGEAFRVAGKAAELCNRLGASLDIAASYDPVLHRNVFGALTSVISDTAGKVFRFNDQKDLHNTVIDRSLAALYGGFLDRAVALAGEKGVAAHPVLLEGKPYESICSLAASLDADLVVVGRTGLHRGRYGDIGSNAERIAEKAKTSVLVVRDPSPEPLGEGDAVKQPGAPAGHRGRITWDRRSGERLERIPAFARPMAARAIEQFAQENGHERITPEIMDRAREELGL